MLDLRTSEFPSWRILLSVGLVATAFLVPSVSLIVLIALVPYFDQVLRSRSLVDKLRQTLWFSIFAQGAVCFWLVEAAKASFHLPAPLAAVVCILFFAINQMQFYFTVCCYHYFVQRRNIGVGALIFLASVYTVFDAYAPKPIPDSIGYCLSSSLWIRQMADIGGVQAITFFVVTINLLAWWSVDRIRRREPIVPLTISILCTFGLAIAYGAWRISSLQATPTLAQLPVLLIRGEIDPEWKFRALAGDVSTQQKILSSYLSLSERGLAAHTDVKLIVWPETSFTAPYQTTTGGGVSNLSEQLRDFVKRTGVTLAVGGFTRNFGDANSSFNSIIVIRPTGEAQIYRKNILMPFTEEIPYVGQFAFVRSVAKYQTNRANGMNLIEVETSARRLQAIPVICFESFSAQHLLRGVRQGGDFILNISEDVWYDSGAESRLHSNIAALESVMSRRAQIRTAAGGFTGTIDRFGEMHEGEQGLGAAIQFANFEVTAPVETVFTQTRGYFVTALGAFALLFLGIVKLAETRLKLSRVRSD